MNSTKVTIPYLNIHAISRLMNYVIYLIAIVSRPVHLQITFAAAENVGFYWRSGMDVQTTVYQSSGGNQKIGIHSSSGMVSNSVHFKVWVKFQDLFSLFQLNNIAPVMIYLQ